MRVCLTVRGVDLTLLYTSLYLIKKEKRERNNFTLKRCSFVIKAERLQRVPWVLVELPSNFHEKVLAVGQSKGSSILEWLFYCDRGATTWPSLYSFFLFLAFCCSAERRLQAEPPGCCGGVGWDSQPRVSAAAWPPRAHHLLEEGRSSPWPQRWQDHGTPTPAPRPTNLPSTTPTCCSPIPDLSLYTIPPPQLQITLSMLLPNHIYLEQLESILYWAGFMENCAALFLFSFFFFVSFGCGVAGSGRKADNLKCKEDWFRDIRVRGS